MQDLSQMSTEELLRMRDGARQQSSPPRGPVFGPAPAPPAPPTPVQTATLDRQERAEGRQAAKDTFRTMTPQEISASGLDPSGVYQVNGLGEYKIVQASTRKAGETQATNQRAANLKSLLRQIDRTEGLFEDNIRGGFPNPIAGRVPFVPETEQFESAAAGTAEQGLSAFRVPGVGSQSNAELQQFVEANRPLATDTDLRIQEKLMQLRMRAVSELEALGFTLEDDQPEQAAPPAFGDNPQAPPPSQPPQYIPPDYRLGAGLSSGDDLENPAIAAGETRREDNPALTGARNEYARRLGEGQTAKEIIQWARTAGIHPSAFGSIQEQVKFRDENPAVPIEQYDTTQLDDRFVQLSALEQNVGEAAQSAVGTGLISAANAISGFTLDNIAGAVGGNAERARLGLDVLAQQRPVTSALGTVAGGVAAALGGEAALGVGLGLRAGLPRALAADSAFGAVAGAGSTDDGSSRLVGALKGAAAAGAGSLAGQKAGQGLQRLARGNGNPSVQTLRNAGVDDLTVGQTGTGRVGDFVRGAEDRLSGISVIGDMVNARRTEGLRQFNQAAFKKALEPIGGNVGDKVGQDAIEEAQAQVSQAYKTALSGVGIVPDAAFNQAFSKSLMGVQGLRRVGPEIFDDVVDVFKAYDADSMLSGEAIDIISRELRNIKSAYRQDPRFTAISKQIDTVERAVFDLADRQASGTIPEYMAARRAYHRVSTLEDAVLKAQNQKDQVFTAAQLRRSDITNTKEFGGKRAAARGDTPFNELARAGQDVLPNRVPDSGTAGRLLIPLLAVGGGAGVDQASGGGSGTGLTIGAIIAGLYSRTGQRLLTKPARGMKPNTRRNALAQNPNTARALGATGGAGSAAVLIDQR